MEITTEDSHIKAGWIKVRLETEDDVLEFNTDEFTDKINDAHEAQDYAYCPYDDEIGIVPRVQVTGTDDEGHTVVAIVDSVRGDIWELDTLPTTLAIWSYDRRDAQFE